MYIKSLDKKNNTESHFKFIFAMIVFSGMFFIRDVQGVAIPNIMFIIVSAIMFIIFDINEDVAFAITLTIFGCGLQVNYVLGLGLLIICIKKYKTMKISLYFLPIVFMLSWELFHLFIQPSDIIEYFRIAINFLMLAIIVCDKKVKYDSKLVLETFALITIFVFLDIFFQTLNYYGSLNEYLSSNLRLGNTNTLVGNSTAYVLSNNQNYLGILAAYSIAGLLVVFNYITKTKAKLFIILEITILIIFGILTQSRTFIVVTLFVFVYCIIAIFIAKRNNLWIAFFSILFIILIILQLLNIIIPNFTHLLIDRFTEEEITGGRLGLFGSYLRYIFTNSEVFVFGIGLQNILIKIGILEYNYSYFNMFQVPHNLILELFLCWGIVGILLFIYLIIIIIKNAKESNNVKKIPLINYSILLTCLVATQAGQLITMHERILILALAFCCLQMTKIKQIKQKI